MVPASQGVQTSESAVASLVSGLSPKNGQGEFSEASEVRDRNLEATKRNLRLLVALRPSHGRRPDPEVLAQSRSTHTQHGSLKITYISKFRQEQNHFQAFNHHSWVVVDNVCHQLRKSVEA